MLPVAARTIAQEFRVMPVAQKVALLQQVLEKLLTQTAPVAPQDLPIPPRFMTAILRLGCAAGVLVCNPTTSLDGTPKSSGGIPFQSMITPRGRDISLAQLKTAVTLAELAQSAGEIKLVAENMGFIKLHRRITRHGGQLTKEDLQQDGGAGHLRSLGLYERLGLIKILKDPTERITTTQLGDAVATHVIAVCKEKNRLLAQLRVGTSLGAEKVDPHIGVAT